VWSARRTLRRREELPVDEARVVDGEEEPAHSPGLHHFHVQSFREHRDLPATLAGRPLLPLDDASGVWAASARQVLTGAAQAPVPQAAAAAAATAQPCVSCGLSLSANARFCRRCGSRQG